MSSTIAEFTIVLLLILTLFVQHFAAAQTTLPDYCTDNTATADFVQCVYSNTETCGDCYDADIYENNINFTSCAGLTDHVCPFFRCCSACATKTERFFECNIFPDYKNTLLDLQSCAFDCSVWEVY